MASYPFDRYMKIGAASLAALTLFSGVRGCVGERNDNLAVDVAITETIKTKGAGQHRINTNGVTRIGFVREGHAVVPRSGAGPVMLAGKADSCLVASFKVVSGSENLPFWKWAGVSGRDFDKTIHRNPANAELSCATVGDALVPVAEAAFSPPAEDAEAAAPPPVTAPPARSQRSASAPAPVLAPAFPAPASGVR